MSIISRDRTPASADNPQDRTEEPEVRVRTPDSAPPRGKLRRVVGAVVTAVAAVAVYVALVVPDTIARHAIGASTLGGFVRLPLEAILGGALLLVVPAALRRWTAVLLGLGLGFLTVLKVANAGFLQVLGRRFNLILDIPLFKDGLNALTETDGHTYAMIVLVGGLTLIAVAWALLTLSVVRLANVTSRHAGPARRTLVGLTAVWAVLAVTGVTFFPNAPVAADSMLSLGKTTVKQVPESIRDEQEFNRATRNDPFATVPPKDLVAGLDGKDVVIGVVESYGRSSLTDPGMKAIVDPIVTAGTRTLAAKGFHAKSGWLTSSTFGGGSWLAHGSFQSGLWINSQQRYKQLTGSNRLTITKAFHEAGWQTYGMEPGNTTDWPEASFYGYDKVYDSRNLGYAGPRFGWSSMPDQYTIQQFQKDVYGKPHAPLMAEITMTSSHEPWTPIPSMVDWDAIGNGAIYGPMAQNAPSRDTLWKSAKDTQASYAHSIAYSVQTLISWVEKYGDDNLVLVFFGDHQPMSIVSGGDGASHDIPITVVAHDQSVLDKIAGWNWTDGLLPAPNAPVWQMNAFRDKFFAAYQKNGKS